MRIMATVYRKPYAKDLPTGSEIITRRGKKFARWIDGRNRTQTAELSDDGQSVVITSPVWYARYRDADGVEKRVSTGCRDEQAAGQVLADLLTQAEKVRSGILTADENHAAGHAARPLAEHFADYLDFLKVKIVRGRKVSDAHRGNVAKQLNWLAQECGFRRIGDITAQRVIKWMSDRADTDDMAPRTVNTHRAALVAFCNWTTKNQRMVRNPLDKLPKADESEVRRKRRPLEVEEIGALLKATTARPLIDALTIRRGKRKGQQVAKVSDVERERLIRLGRERALIYKTLIYTGLRKGELASLTVSDLHLDAERPYARLAAKSAKSGKGAGIPLRADLADDLRDYLADKLSDYRRRTLADGRTECPTALPGKMKLFYIPRDFIKIFNRDLVAAGLARKVEDPETGKTRIAKTDDEGRTVDIHCLRHSFATMLSKANVAPRMAQELLRHSDIRLTMNTYTHLQLVDTSGAVEALPDISHTDDESSRQVRTGTDDRVCGAEIGAVIGAGLQENGGHACHAVSSRHDRPTKTDRAKPLKNRTKRRPKSSADNERPRATEGIRTLDVQLGKLTFYH